MVTLIYVSFLVWVLSLFPQRVFGPLFAAWIVVTPIKQTLVKEELGFQLIDPIIVLALMTIVALFISSRTRLKNLQWIHKYIILVHLLFAILMCISLLWSPSPSYGSYKAYRFLIFNTLLLLAPIVLIKDTYDFETMGRWAMILMLLVYLKISIFPVYDGIDGALKSGRAGFGFGEESATAGVCMASAYAFMKIFQTGQKRVQILYLLIIACILFGAMMAATRTVIFSIIMTPFLMMTFLPRSAWKKSWFFPVILSAGVILLVIAITPDQQFGRFADSSHGDESIFARFLLWQKALEAFSLHPIAGLGIGGQSFFDTGRDSRWFCHNIFLETMGELGIIGTILLVILLVLVGILIFRNRLKQGLMLQDTNKLTILYPFSCVIFITYFAQTLVTDDLADNRWLWLNIGLIIAATIPDRIFPIKLRKV